MRKKILLVILILVFIGIVSFIYTRMVLVEKERGAPPTASVPALAAPRNYPSFQTSVRFSYANVPVGLPEKLPEYSLSYPENFLEKAKGVARIWGFSSSPTSPVPDVYDWIEGGRQFSLDERSAKHISYSVSFSSLQEPSAVSLKKDSAIQNLLLLNQDAQLLSFKETSSEKMVAKGEGGDGRTVIRSSYQYVFKDTSYPLFFNSMVVSSGSMQTTVDGIVTTLSFSLLPSLLETEEKTTLSPEQILIQLNEQRGFLQRVVSQEEDFHDDPLPDFDEVHITNISVAYFVLSDTNSLVPIYVIQGLGKGTEVQEVRYFLRATL